MVKEFKLYRIDIKYIRNLQNIDKRVYSVSPQTGKEYRPYLGIIVICKKQKYCIPLTSFKDKHNNIRDKIDFSKINIDGTDIAAINFSRMIPVEDKQLKEIDLKIRRHDSNNLIERKNLLKAELNWCNEHSEDIENKANVLYKKYISGEYFKRKKDCLNFIQLEEVCKKYNYKG
ncbi:MAG: type III toxin-antitoxin system ToxN/AbiQ family toxin [Lachnospiraceae bacterium]|nr:type III toxin-antitoxin system ToxN/AbiQ family toxin [Lachnospiraceae bacterium]